MAKKQAAKDQDKFVVRLPVGMRDRIKAKADRAGMSMNEAIVWCLEQHFPAPMTFDQKVHELVEMVALLKGDGSEAAVDTLIGEIDATLSQISDKKLATPSEFRAAVSERYQRYLDDEQDRLRDLHEDPFDEANWPSTADPNWDPFVDVPPEKKG